MTKQIEIVADENLAMFLMESGDLQIAIDPVDDNAEHQALECGLETAAAVITIITGAITIAETAAKLTPRIKEWLAKRRATSTALVFRGATDDVALRVDPETDAATVGRVIERTCFDCD